MPIIKLETRVHAPRNICFDLSRSIDLHLISAKNTGEKAIAGRTSGLIAMGERVTWLAKHFGFWQKLEVEITAFEQDVFFKDEMVSGAFSSMAHVHEFESIGEETLMRDIFEYKSPLGPIGRLFDLLFLEKYMRDFLMKRNDCLKEIAEGEQAKNFIRPAQL